MRIVRESLYNFNKTGNVKRSLKIGKILIRGLLAYNLKVDDNNIPDLSDEDTEYFFTFCHDNNVDIEITDAKFGPPGAPQASEVNLFGTRDDLIRVLTLFDAAGREYEELKRDLDKVNWFGEEDKLIDILYN